MVAIGSRGEFGQFFSLGVRTSETNTGAAALEIIADANNGFFLRELRITLTTATASIFGIGRPAAIGITPTAPVAVLAQRGGGNGLITTALAWGTGPTVPAKFYDRLELPATIGAAAILAWDELWVPPAGTIVLWNLSAVSTADVSIKVEGHARVGKTVTVSVTGDQGVAGL